MGSVQTEVRVLRTHVRQIGYEEVQDRSYGNWWGNGGDLDFVHIVCCSISLQELYHLLAVANATVMAH